MGTVRARVFGAVMSAWWEDLWLSNGAAVFLGSEEAALQLMNADSSRLNAQQQETQKVLRARQEAMNASKGLGDTIAKMTGAMGIRPCGGCKKRQELLNRMFPYEKNGGQ